jgi:hypothetical protein
MKEILSLMKLAFIGLLLVSMSGCFQYPEGPFFTMQTRDERLSGNWAIDQVLNRDGEDITSEFADLTLFALMGKEDQNSISLFKSSILDSFGTYSFADHSDYLIIIYTTYNGVDVSSEVVQKFLEVRRLTDKWLYYIDDEGFEWHWEKY